MLCFPKTFVVGKLNLFRLSISTNFVDTYIVKQNHRENSSCRKFYLKHSWRQKKSVMISKFKNQITVSRTRCPLFILVFVYHVQNRNRKIIPLTPKGCGQSGTGVSSTFCICLFLYFVLCILVFCLYLWMFCIFVFLYFVFFVSESREFVYLWTSKEKQTLLFWSVH